MTLDTDRDLIRARTLICSLLVVSLLAWLMSWKVPARQEYHLPELHLLLEMCSIGGFSALFLTGWHTTMQPYPEHGKLLAFGFLGAALFAAFHVISFPDAATSIALTTTQHDLTYAQNYAQNYTQNYTQNHAPQFSQDMLRFPILFSVAARSAVLISMTILSNRFLVFLHALRISSRQLIGSLLVTSVVCAYFYFQLHATAIPGNLPVMHPGTDLIATEDNSPFLYWIGIFKKVLCIGFLVAAVGFYQQSLISVAPEHEEDRKPEKEKILLAYACLGFALAELCFSSSYMMINFLSILGQVNLLAATVLVYRYITIHTIQLPYASMLSTNQELFNRNSRLTGIIQTASEGIITINSDHKIILNNPAAAAFFGFSEREMLGMNLDQVIPVKHRKHHSAHVSKFGTTGITLRQMGHDKSEFSVTGLKKNGEEFPIEASISSMQEGANRFYTVIFRDISDRKIARERMQLYQEELSHLSHSLQTIREEERKHIARELHDDLGQLLAALRMDLTILKKSQSNNVEAQPFIESMDQLILTSIATLRRIATNLRPRALDEGGLYFALKSLQKDFRQHHGIDCELHANEHELVLNDDLSTTVFRVIQESLTNVARHADASRVSIQLEQIDDHLHFKIQDNGHGIESHNFLKKQSFGIIGMRERVRALNGDLSIIANAENGTCIEVNLPLSA